MEIGKLKGAPLPLFIDFPHHLKRLLLSSYLKIILTLTLLKVTVK